MTRSEIPATTEIPGEKDTSEPTMAAAQSGRTSEGLDGPDRQTFQPAIALLGIVIVLLGVSGLVDDSGLLEHPWWIVLVAAAVVACAAVILRTVVSLRH